jgi:hypothetical protein
MDQSDGQTGKVGHIVVEKLGRLIHFVVKAAVSHLQIENIHKCNCKRYPKTIKE